jgi:hypothetical protein
MKLNFNGVMDNLETIFGTQPVLPAGGGDADS